MPLATAPASRLFGSLLAFVASLVALALPLGYFGLSYGAMASALETKAQIKAEFINQAINASPEMWRFEEHRLMELLTRFPVEPELEQALIRDESGETVAASTHQVDTPLMQRSAPLYDAGVPVGQVDVRRSLRGLWLGTGVAAVLGLALAGALVSLLRFLQSRERRILNVMFDERERARVTLHSIADAVITTDAAERIDYLNPVAEALTQWPLAQAKGMPVHEVFCLVDEVKRQPLPAPVVQALRQNRPQPFNGEATALVRRDGSAVAIEASAAPIHDRQGELIGGAMVFHDVTTTRRMAQRISWAAAHDSLTGLTNRREFETRVDAALASAHNTGRHHVLCYLDLDQFKVVNDTCGHAAGDALLKQLSALLQAKLRESDTLARLGGDEFGVLLEGCALERAQLIAADMLGAVRAYRFVWEGRVFGVTASLGLVAVTAESGSRADVFSAADTACYAAKDQGRNRICVFNSRDLDIAQRRTEMGWAARLAGALEEQRFVLYYQRFEALGEAPAQGPHIEVLLRLVDEQGKLVMPGSFLPAAERYNLMPAIDRWVIQTVLAQYHHLARNMGAPLTCAVNLSGTSLNSEGMVEFLREQLLAHQIPAGALCLEITETAAINNLHQATDLMRQARALGVSFALDDFGVGSSSFAYLKTLPVDILKIDGSFVRNIARDAVDRAMVESINRVGHIMGLRTVGEFAESPEVIAELRTLGVDFAQGYGVHQPQPLPVVPATPGGWAPTI